MMERVGRATGTGTTGGLGETPAVASSSAAVRRGVAVVLLLVAAVVGGALAGPWHPVLRSVGPEVTRPPVTPTPEPSPEPDPLTESLRAMHIEPWDLTFLTEVLAVLVLAGLGYLVVRLWRARPRLRIPLPGDAAGVEPGPTVGASAEVLPDLPALREGVEGAGAHLRARLKPADAVIAAWVALEDGAAGSGVVRDPASTPTEFTVEVLGRTPVDPGATRTLLRLYLRARFGDDPVTPDDVAAATAAVRTLAAGLVDPEADGPLDHAGGAP